MSIEIKIGIKKCKENDSFVAAKIYFKNECNGEDNQKD